MFFGRVDNETCPHENANATDCEASDAFDVVRRYCNGRQECYVSAQTEVFDDPCAGTSKHAYLDFACHSE